MSASKKSISLTYSLADQSFAKTKSLGILNVSIELLHALAQHSGYGRLTVLSNHSLDDALNHSPRITIENYNSADAGKLQRIWWDQYGAYTAAKHSQNEWLFLPKGFASFARRCPVRLATMVHDLMQNHYDLHYPNTTSGLESAYFRSSLRASLQQSEVIFTPTESVRSEIESFVHAQGWRLPRIVCCGEGFARPPLLPKREKEGIVVLASRFPHKLTALAVEFLSRWQQQNEFHGDVHWIGSLPSNLELPTHQGWQRYARLPEAAFRTLLGRAQAVLYFSDYEGFGRPPVEAVFAGACPVYSDLAVTREVMEDRGCPFQNISYESFDKALRLALSISQEQLSVWANELSAKHDWNIVADRIFATLSA